MSALTGLAVFQLAAEAAIIALIAHWTGVTDAGSIFLWIVIYLAFCAFRAGLRAASSTLIAYLLRSRYASDVEHGLNALAVPATPISLTGDLLADLYEIARSPELTEAQREHVYGLAFRVHQLSTMKPADHIVVGAIEKGVRAWFARANWARISDLRRYPS